MTPTPKIKTPLTTSEALPEEHVERIVVDDESFDAVCRELENPSPPNDKLIALFKKK